MTIRQTIMQGDYDSVFEAARADRPATLRLRLKIALLPRDPSRPADPKGVDHYVHLANNARECRLGWVPDADDEPFFCRSWMVDEFNKYKIRFKQMVELVWNRQMILIPPPEAAGDGGMSDADYRQLIGDPRVPAHVECAIDIQLVTVDHPPHFVMEVVRLNKDEQHGFRSYSELLSNEDIEFTTYRDKRWRSLLFAEVTAAHEVGHWLGNLRHRTFEHIEFEACSKLPDHAANNKCEYGRTPSKRMGIMGAGNVATDYEAQPWLSRVRRHTQALGNWTMVHRVNFTRGPAQITDRQKQLAGVAVK